MLPAPEGNGVVQQYDKEHAEQLKEESEELK